MILYLVLFIFIYELFSMPRYFEESSGSWQFTHGNTSFRRVKRSELSVFFHIFILSMLAVPLYIEFVVRFDDIVRIIDKVL
jgi:Ca2+/Na+ antiporter